MKITVKPTVLSGQVMVREPRGNGGYVEQVAYKRKTRRPRRIGYSPTTRIKHQNKSTNTPSNGEGKRHLGAETRDCGSAASYNLQNKKDN
jgi:hypothetical protein